MNIITSESIVSNVYESVENNMFLPVGEKCSLEYLSKDYDAIFPTPASWNQFIVGNFYTSGQWREEVKESTIKKWAWKFEMYVNRFAVKIGRDRYLAVDKKEIELAFDYDVYYERNTSTIIPSAVEFFVTAQIKEQ